MGNLHSIQIARQTLSLAGEKVSLSCQRLNLLKPREWQVLRLIAEGHASKQIGALLEISINTVNNHRAAILAKLGTHSAAGAVNLLVTALHLAASPNPATKRAAA